MFSHKFTTAKASSLLVCVKLRRFPPYPPPKYKVGNFPFSPVKDREAGQIRQATAGVGLNWDENLRLWQRDKELWLFPVGIEALIGKVRFFSVGD